MNTKAYTVLLAVIVVAGFVLIGAVFFHDPVLVKQRAIITCINIDSLKEAGDSIMAPLHGPGVDKIFPANHQNTKDDPIPWADVYLCHSCKKADSLSGDTLIMLLSTQINDKLSKIEYPTDYWTDLKKAHTFQKVKVMMPPEQLSLIKKARYKFVSVGLVTDDY